MAGGVPGSPQQGMLCVHLEMCPQVILCSQVGSAGFNPSDYRANLESNYYNRHSSKERAHGDYNLLSHKGQESPGAAPTASGEKVGFAASKTAFPQSP